MNSCKKKYNFFLSCFFIFLISCNDIERDAENLASCYCELSKIHDQIDKKGFKKMYQKQNKICDDFHNELNVKYQNDSIKNLKFNTKFQEITNKITCQEK